MLKNGTLFYIRKIQKEEFSYIELREFIEFCTEISLFLLKKNHQNIKKRFDNNNISFEDVAVDSITPLFIKDDYLNVTGFKFALNSWRKEIINEADAHFFVLKVITKKTSQTVNSILGEIDPLYKKLLKNISYQSYKLGYKKAYRSGIAYLIDPGSYKRNGKIVTDEHFEQIPLNIPKDKISVNICDVFAYLKNNTEYISAIPLNKLILRLKNIYVNLLESKPGEDNIQLVLEVKFSIERALNSTLNKLEKSYVNKEILSEFEADIMKKALLEVSSDLMDGGIQPGLENYLLPYFDNFSKNDVALKYRNIFDYLIRCLKKEIYKELDF